MIGMFTSPTPLFASVAGGGSGFSSGSRCTLEEAITIAREDAVIELAAGAYAGPAAIITKRVRIVPASGASPTLASGRMWQSRTSGASFTISGYTATAATGTNETYISIVPVDYVRGSKPAVVALHGASGTEEQMLGSWPASIRNIVTAIVVDGGYPVICPHAAGDSWGNLTAMARISEAVAVARSTLGASSAPVALLGFSMGGANALNWAKRNLSDTACVVGAVPASDISDIHTNNRGSLAGQINAAHSTWTEASRGADFNPATFAAADLAGLAYQAWGATSDTVCLPATVEAVADAIGGTCTEVAGDHTTAMANITPSTVVTFIEEHT